MIARTIEEKFELCFKMFSEDKTNIYQYDLNGNGDIYPICSGDLIADLLNIIADKDVIFGDKQSELSDVANNAHISMRASYQTKKELLFANTREEKTKFVKKYFTGEITEIGIMNIDFSCGVSTEAINIRDLFKAIYDENKIFIAFQKSFI